MKKRLSALLLIAVMVAALFAGCGNPAPEPTPANTPAATPAQPTPEAPAEDEPVTGSILLYTSMPDADAARLIEAFEGAHPGITVEVFRSGTEEVISRLYAEYEGGQILADVLLVADVVTFERLKQDGLLMAYQSPEHVNIDSEFIDPDFMFTGTKAISSLLV